MAKSLEDKQASGYINMEDLLKVSGENGFIPEYIKVYSIYAGDTAIMEELTPQEQESNIFTTKELGVADRSYLSVGTFDSYLAYLLSEEVGEGYDNLVNYQCKMKNTSSKEFIDQYVLLYNYLKPVPKFPVRSYSYDGSDYYRQTVDIMKIQIGEDVFDFSEMFTGRDFDSKSIMKLNVGDSQGYIGVP